MLRVRGSLDLRRPPVISIESTKLRFAESLRYLGVVYGHSLSVSEHVAYVSAHARARFSSMSALIGSKWGYDFRARTILYKGIFLPIISYGAIGWAHKLSVKHLSTLRSMQRTALLRVCAAYRTTSTDALCILANQIPLDLYLIEKRYRFLVRKNIPFMHREIVFDPENCDDPEFHQQETLDALRANTLNLWQIRWISSTKGRTTFEFFPNLAGRSDCHVPITHYTTQFLTGHGNFRGKLHDFNLVESPECACGEESEYSSHVLLHCRLYDAERAPLIQAANSIGLQWPPPLPTLVNRHLGSHFSTFARKVLQRKEIQPVPLTELSDE